MRSDAAAGRPSRRRTPTGTIRPYRPEDREAVRRICRRTAYRNRGSAALFEDDELFADYWTSYYTDREPESCLVVEEEGEVIGYLLGSADTPRMVATMARSIVPRILGLMLWRLATFRYRNPATRRTIMWMLFYSWREAPSLPIRKYPGHYHCNILRQGRGKGYYTAMAVAFADMLLARGVTRMHGQVEEFADSGVWRQMAENYQQETGTSHLLEHYSEKPSHFQRVVLGVDKPMINRAWGCKVEDYRSWLEWMAKKYHM